MGRAIVGAIAGYVVMAVAVMLGISAAWFAMGSSVVFHGVGPDVSAVWSIVCLALGFPSAVLGGWVAARLGKDSARNAVRALVGLILVLGISSSVWQLKTQQGVNTEETSELGSPTEPVESMSFRKAGAQARQPAWYLWVLPWTGALGALFGGSIVTKEQP